MKVLLLIVLIILGLAVGLITAATWYKWQIYVHLKDNRLDIELRSAFFNRRLVSRDFSKAADKDKKRQKKSKANKENKKSGIGDRFKADKDRIYSKENGYNHQGLIDVIGEYKEIYSQIKDALYKILGDMRHKIEIPLTRIKLEFGTGNPAHTGMLYGGIWGGIGVAYPIVRGYVNMAYPQVDVTPDFEGKRFKIEIKSIINIRPAHVINALLKYVASQGVTYCFKKIKNLKKGSVKNG